MKNYVLQKKKYYFAKRWACHGTPGTLGVDGPVAFKIR